jgi:hypothetical protein
VTVDGGYLYVANTVSGTVKKYDATTGAFIGDFITGGPGAFDLLPMAVPEPSSAALLLAGLLLIGATARRMKRR